jgi:Gly-Xaa carboxypeptidase
MSVFEELLTSDWRPQRDFVIGLGFDEECSGFRGAKNINDMLIEKYGKDGFAAVIDEGGLGMIDLDFGHDPPVRYALPAVTEKGFVNIWLDLQVKGGHSSTPTPHTGIGIMSQMVVALENNPYYPEIEWNSPIHKSLQCLARFSPNAFPSITHLVDHGDLYSLAQVVGAMDLSAAALLQTTQAVDIIAGGDKINSLPEFTTVGINYRVAPQNSVLEVQHNVVKHISRIVENFGLNLNAYEGDDEYHHYAASIGGGHHHKKPRRDIDYEGTLTIRAEKKFNGAPVSPTDDEAWRIFAGTIEATFKEPGITVVPTGVIMTGNTDTKHYLGKVPSPEPYSPCVLKSRSC